MANEFNLQNYLNTYKQTNYDPTKQHAAAEEKMEERLQAKAAKAINSGNFLGLTLKEKMTELGIGEKVVQQIADTALNVVTGFVDPLNNYLEKYENIFDERIYNTEIQSYAKQMFFASQAMAQDAEEHTVGQNFVLDM